MAPSTRTHQKSAGAPSRNSSSSGHDRDLGAAGDQLAELLVGQAVEDAQGPEFGDLHQIVAR